MGSRQIAIGLGGVALAGAGYYLYTAGGDPKLAEKNAEHDAATLRARVSGNASSRATDTQKGLEASAQQVGSNVDYAIQQAKNEGKYYQNQVQAFGKDVQHQAADAVEYAKKQTTEVQKELQKYERDAEKQLKEAYDKAKTTGQQYASQLQGYQSEAEKKLDQARKETGNQLSKAVDGFDKTVDDGTTKAKSGIFNWFGGGK